MCKICKYLEAFIFYMIITTVSLLCQPWPPPLTSHGSCSVPPAGRAGRPGRGQCVPHNSIHQPGAVDLTHPHHYPNMVLLFLGGVGQGRGSSGHSALLLLPTCLSLMKMVRVMMMNGVRAGGCTVPCRGALCPTHDPGPPGLGVGLRPPCTLFSRAHIGLNGNDCDHSDFFDFCTVMQSKLNITSSQSLWLLLLLLHLTPWWQVGNYCAIHVITAGMCWRLSLRWAAVMGSLSGVRGPGSRGLAPHTKFVG